MSTDREPAWEDMGYGALPEHLKDNREDWQKLGYSSKQEHETKRWGDPGGDVPVTRHTGSRLSESKPDRVWRKPRIVAQAKCRRHTSGCRNTVDVTEEGLAQLEQFSAILVARNEAPLGLNDCFMCDACVQQRFTVMAQAAAERRGKVTDAVRYLKHADGYALDKATDLVKGSATVPPRTSDDVVAAMERLVYLTKVMGSGYVADLVIAIRDGRKTPGKAKPKAGDL